MKRINIYPIKEVVYPNRGGYTGFSIDELTEKEKRLWKENGRRGIHIDEMMDDKLRKRIRYCYFRTLTPFL